MDDNASMTNPGSAVTNQATMCSARTLHGGRQHRWVEQQRREALLIFKGQPNNLRLFDRSLGSLLGRRYDKVTDASTLQRGSMTHRSVCF